MAICYECDNEFYGEKCWHCGWWAEYPCWNCKFTIRAEHEELCGDCQWYICPRCEACGCDPNCPKSRQERRKEQEDISNTRALFADDWPFRKDEVRFRR